MDKDTVVERLRKLKALADRGTGGERENAQQIYKELLGKYQIEEPELLENQVSLHWFSFEKEIEESILTQVMYKVTGDEKTYKYKDNRVGKKKRACECTELEAAEIKMLFSFYQHELERELETFIGAFMARNALYPDSSARCYHKQPPAKLTSEDKAKLRKTAYMAALMSINAPPRALIGQEDVPE